MLVGKGSSACKAMTDLGNANLRQANSGALEGNPIKALTQTLSAYPDTVSFS